MKLFNLLKKNTEEIDETPQAEYDWRAESFKIINILLSKDEVTRCKIVDVKEKGLMVKVENLYAYLPFQLRLGNTRIKIIGQQSKIREKSCF